MSIKSIPWRAFIDVSKTTANVENLKCNKWKHFYAKDKLNAHVSDGVLKLTESQIEIKEFYDLGIIY